jgi:hypothetical protein
MYLFVVIVSLRFALRRVTFIDIRPATFVNRLISRLYRHGEHLDEIARGRDYELHRSPNEDIE